MSYTVTILPAAQADLAEASEDIAEHYSLQKSIEVIRELIAYYSGALGQFPYSGAVYSGAIRKLTHKKYSAFYIALDDIEEVEIIHIVDLTKPLDQRGIDL